MMTELVVPLLAILIFIVVVLAVGTFERRSALRRALAAAEPDVEGVVIDARERFDAAAPHLLESFDAERQARIDKALAREGIRDPLPAGPSSQAWPGSGSAKSNGGARIGPAAARTSDRSARHGGK